MKKIYPLVILAILLTCPLFIQAQKKISSWVSADAGLNTNWILNQNAFGNPEMAYSPKFKFSGGAAFKHFIDNYGYSAGLGIGRMGQNYSGEMSGADAQRKINLTYLQAPVMLMYYLGGNKQNKWVSVGAQFMYLLAANQNFTRSEGGRILVNTEMMDSTNVIRLFKPTDVMLTFEITQIFSPRAYRKIKTLFSINGALGLTDINSKESRTPNIHNVYGSSHNFYLGFHVGFMYNVNAHASNKTKLYNRKTIIKPFR